MSKENIKQEEKKTEKEVVETTKQSVLERTKRIDEKIAKIKKHIDSNCKSSATNTFVYKFKRKPRLKKALKVLFGAKNNQITWEQYKFAVEVKKNLEMKDGNSFFKKDEEEK